MIKKLLVLMFCIVLLSTVVSSLEFDNVKSNYDYETRIAIIKNAFGLGDVIAEAKLVSPQHKYIMDKNDYVAEIEIDNKQIYSNFITGIEFYRASSFMEKINDGEFSYKFYNNYYYENVTTDIPTTKCLSYYGNTTCETYETIKVTEQVQGRWETLDTSKSLPIGKVKIRMYYNKDLLTGEIVEWLPEFYGVKIPEWASFSNALLKEYNRVVDGAGQVGNNGIAQNFTIGDVGLDEDFELLGIALYVQKGSCTSVDIRISSVNASGLPDPTTNHSIIENHDCSTWPSPEADWINITMPIGTTLNASTTYALVITDRGGGNFIWNSSVADVYAGGTMFSSDNIEVWYDLSVDGGFEIWGYGPERLVDINVTLVQPADALITNEGAIQFAANGTSYFDEQNLTNATLNIWYNNGSLFDTNFETLSGSSNISNLSMMGIPNGFTFDWNFEFCGTNATGSNCNYSITNRSFSTVPYEVNSQNFNGTAFETSKQLFELNITTLAGIISATANLIYNGTSNTGTANCVGNECNISSILDIPLIETAQETKNLFWQVTVYDAGGYHSYNTTPTTQIINNTYLEFCNDTWTTPYVNFSVYNAINPNPPINATFKINADFWLGDGIIKANNSYEDLNENVSVFKFCGYPDTRTLIVDASLEFDGGIFSQNNHYYEGEELSSIVKEQYLYMLNDTLSTLTTLQVVNDLQQGLTNRLIEIILFDIGTGEEKVVSMASTDHNGEDIVYLNWFDSLYKFVIINDGEVELTVEPYKVGETPQIFKVIERGEFNQDKFDDVIWSLDFNNNTNVYSVTFNDPNEEISAGCLRVVKAGGTSYTILSDACLNTTSGTLSFNITPYLNGTFLGVFYAKGSNHIFGTLLQVIKDISEDIFEQLGNLDATLIAIILVGSASMFGIFISPALGILLLLLGYVAAMALGFADTKLIAVFAGVAAAGILLIWKLKT